MAVDFLRSCYATQMKFFTDSDTYVAVRWYFCAPGAKNFPGYTRFGSGNWASDKLDWPGVGEVLGSPRPWVDGSPPPWGTSVCLSLAIDCPPVVYMKVTRYTPDVIPMPFFEGQIITFTAILPFGGQYLGPLFPAANSRGSSVQLKFGTDPFFPNPDYMQLDFNDDEALNAIPAADSSLSAGGHFCGSEEVFAQGVEYPGESVNTADAGNCNCCGGPAWTVKDFNIYNQLTGATSSNTMDVRFAWSLADL